MTRRLIVGLLVVMMSGAWVPTLAEPERPRPTTPRPQRPDRPPSGVPDGRKPTPRKPAPIPGLVPPEEPSKETAPPTGIEGHRRVVRSRGTAKSAPVEHEVRPAVPMRPPLAPLDLADERACAFELARLASFTCYLNSMRDYRANAAGMDPDPQRGVLLDELARLDRLASAESLRIRDLAAVVRATWEDNWRVTLANRDFGKTVENEQESMGEMLGAYLTHFAVSQIGQGMRERSVRSFRAPHGQMMEEVTISDEPSALELRADAALSKSIESSEVAAQHRRVVSEQVDVARGMLKDGLSELWDSSLLELVTTASPQDLDASLIRLGSPSELIQGDTGLASGQYGLVAIRNESGMSLHDVVIRLRFTDSGGYECANHAAFDLLAPGDTIVMWPSGSFERLILETSESFRVNASVWSEEGTQHDVSAEFRRTSRQGRLTDDQISSLSSRRVEIERSIREQARLVDGMLRTAFGLYGTPTPPIAASERLENTIRTGVDYTVETLGTIEVPVRRVRFRSIGQNTIAAVVTVETRDGIKTVPMEGRIEEELQRGAVIGLYVPPSPDEPAPSGGDPDDMTEKERLMLERKKGITGLTERFELERPDHTDFKTGAAWLITWPSDIAHYKRAASLSARFLAAHLSPISTAQKMENYRNAYADALVVYLDASGELMLQSPDASGSLVAAALVVTEGAP